MGTAMFDSPIFPVTISVLAILAGPLIFYKPVAPKADLLRGVAFSAIGFPVLFMTLSTLIIDAKAGAFFAVVFDPTGQSLIVPNPYGYYVCRVFPAIRAVSLSTAFICPMAYVALSRRRR